MRKLSILLLVVLPFIIVGCASSNDQNIGEESTAVNEGRALYKTYCSSCHGSSGDLGLSGALPLSESKLSDSESLEVVLKGRNVMAGFQGIISEEDAVKIVAYTKTLRK